MVINVYEQYFKADAVFSNVRRNGALVMLISDSENGTIQYKAAVSFFPHRDEEDYAVSYDAYFEKELYCGKGRRSKKKEAAYLQDLREMIDAIIEENGGRVFWDEPLREARRG
ncbi:MAG: hypothetical protein IJI44_03295 [Erysipelotrichaceae bacterium]|nr:hypothetical protein [Erysipelotrichaceae bacterium]